MSPFDNRIHHLLNNGQIFSRDVRGDDQDFWSPSATLLIFHQTEGVLYSSLVKASQKPLVKLVRTAGIASPRDHCARYRRYSL